MPRELNKKYWPYKVKPDYDDKRITEAFNWCKEYLPNWDSWRIVGSNNFYFKNQEDAAWFKLTWG